MYIDPSAAFEADLAREARRQEALEALWRMSADERVAAMRRGELSLDQLCAWSRRRPHEVPKIGGEFEWIVVATVDYIEAESKVLEPPRCAGCGEPYSSCSCEHRRALLIAALERMDAEERRRP